MACIENIRTVSFETTNDEFSIPLCLDDIISICKEFSQLGGQVQNKIECLLDIGVEEAIDSGKVEHKFLPFIRFFLSKVVANPMFGEARDQAEDCLWLIDEYESTHKTKTDALN